MFTKVLPIFFWISSLAAAIHFETYQGIEITPHNPEIISLVNKVFYEYPYLYRGDSEGYNEALRGYAQSTNSYVVFAWDGDKVVGLATGIPLTDSWDKHAVPLRQKGIDVSKAYYLGELVVLPEYRGQGIGYRMGETIEQFARSHGYTLLALMSIDEALMEAPPPQGYISSACTFRKLGYTKHPEIYLDSTWINVGGTAPLSHRMVYWTFPLDR